MYSPTTRVLTVLELLQAHGRLSGPDLAQRLAVDGRTLRRYIGKLEDLGIPILAERGRYGCYSLMPGFKMPPMVFTDDEALAVALGLLAARGLGLAATTPAIESAQAKLERVMPSALKQRVRALGETVALDQTPAEPMPNNHLLLSLSQAAYRRQQVHLVYRAASDDLTARNFDPYGLAHRGGRWYVVGHCHLRQALRSFRLDRIQGLEMLATPFTPPLDFDAVQHLAQGVASIPRAHRITVLLDTDLPTALSDRFATLGLLQPMGSAVLMHSQADDLAWFARELARLPFAFQIQQPPELAEALQDLTLKLQRLGDAAHCGLATTQLH